MYASTSSLDGALSAEAEEGKVTSIPSFSGDQSVFVVIMVLLLGCSSLIAEIVEVAVKVADGDAAVLKS